MSSTTLEKTKNKVKRLKRRLNRRNRQLRTFYIPTNFPKINLARHIKCVSYARVPPNMGWLWTSFSRENDKWKPGYIPKRVRELMLHFIKPIDMLPVGTGTQIKSKKCPQLDLFVPEIPMQKPMLQIKRVNGHYIITMQPLKDSKSLCESVDPYLNMKPIKFLICKQPITVKQHELKKKLKEKGFKKCVCQQAILNCNCRALIEKERLKKEVTNMCEEAGIPNIQHKIYLSDTTESESDLDIDFTPPVGLVKCSLVKKPDAVVKETQYNSADYQKSKPYESPFKILHPNHKVSTKKNKFGRKVIVEGMEKGKKLANDKLSGNREDGDTGGKRGKIDKDAKKIGSKSK